MAPVRVVLPPRPRDRPVLDLALVVDGRPFPRVASWGPHVVAPTAMQRRSDVGVPALADGYTPGVQKSLRALPQREQPCNQD